MTAPPEIPEDLRVTADWPDQLAELAEVIGAVAAMKLAQAYGGVELRVPVRMRTDHPLALLLDAATAGTLSHHYGGERLHLPLASMLLERMRREPVLAAVRAGQLSITAAARQLGMTRRAVQRILRQTNEGLARSRKLAGREKPANPQLDLEDWLTAAPHERDAA